MHVPTGRDLHSGDVVAEFHAEARRLAEPRRTALVVELSEVAQCSSPSTTLKQELWGWHRRVRRAMAAAGPPRLRAPFPPRLRAKSRCTDTSRRTNIRTTPRTPRT